MHNPRIIITIVFCTAVFTGMAFIVSLSQLHRALSSGIGDEPGRVLGASEPMIEAVSPAVTAALKNKFPTNQDRLIIPRPVREINPPATTASSVAVLDCGSGNWLYSKDADNVRPIASITKLATAYVFLNYNPAWEHLYTIKPEDITGGNLSYLAVGEQASVKNLLYLSLVGSDNTATKALVRITGLSENDFVEVMNKEMKKLGLNSTNFEDTVGLSDFNVSTAIEIAQFAKLAFERPVIREATLTKKHIFTTASGRYVTVYNTDALLRSFPQNGITLQSGKTGYTAAAGYCFVGAFSNDRNRQVISVVLGDPEANGRFEQTARIVEWAYGNYVWE